MFAGTSKTPFRCGLLVGLVALLAASAGLARDRTDDRRLQTTVAERLSYAVNPQFRTLEVEVEGGRVTLGGNLWTLAEIWQAVELAEQVHGVIEVSSDLDLDAAGRSADAIRSDIGRAFQERPGVMMNPIEVDVRRGGKVELSGRLQDARARFAAREAVAGVPGVTEVIDRLSSPQASDDAIAKSLRAAFERAKYGGFEGQIDYEVRNGAVTLIGTVPRAFERRQAQRLALGVNGVRRVENRLGVRPDPREVPVVRP